MQFADQNIKELKDDSNPLSSNSAYTVLLLQLQSYLTIAANGNSKGSDHRPIQKVAIEFFEDPSIKDNDKKKIVDWMSHHNLQFQLLNDFCDKSSWKKSRRTGLKKKKSLLKVGRKNLKVNRKEQSFGQRQEQGLLLLDLMIDYGGKEFVMKTENDTRPKSHSWYRRSVMCKQGSLLHAICKTKIHDENEALLIEIVNKLLDIGGKELVVMRDILGQTVLYEAIFNQSSIELITKKIVEVGGEELIMREKQAMDLAFATFSQINIMSC
jgi:hypothetical protein